VKFKTYTQNKQPSDKTQSSKFGQLGVKRTRFQNRKKKGNDSSTTLTAVRVKPLPFSPFSPFSLSLREFEVPLV